MVSTGTQAVSTGEFVTIEHVNQIVQQKMSEIDSLRLELATLRSKPILASATPPQNVDTITQRLTAPKKMKAKR